MLNELPIMALGLQSSRLTAGGLKGKQDFCG
jgi:hypothetical protein